MNPAVIAKKTSVTATNMRSLILPPVELLRVSFPASEALGLHEGIEEVDEQADRTEAGKPCHDGGAHDEAS